MLGGPTGGSSVSDQRRSPALVQPNEIAAGAVAALYAQADQSRTPDFWPFPTGFPVLFADETARPCRGQRRL
jgi:hypothetical protein